MLSKFVKNQYFRHDHQFSSFCQFFVKNDVLWSLLIAFIYFQGYGISDLLFDTAVSFCLLTVRYNKTNRDGGVIDQN